ncbi:double-stranded RNA-binding 4-like [Olea europaea subsp. europaea]|uniref:Double-stranded RNA-binding 4-like n=1 Tax=Olea europaea subsp. europaea TaxID=158383 RepID=A0A8S0R4J0_OLEEU|nr:double-stranded RNA-binding 4-like [Olea europaea subsp. europaea]
MRHTQQVLKKLDFASIVVVGSDAFQGIEARTKEQAKPNAAEVTYIAPTRDKGIYKNDLQEMGQKEGLKFPSYETSPTGPHKTGFVSFVVIGSDTFQKIEARTKK